MSELGALTDVLKFEYTLLEQFHSELSELKLWLGDTRDMLQLDRSSSRGEGEAGGGGGGDGASVYQLRNKHQASGIIYVEGVCKSCFCCVAAFILWYVRFI